MLAAEEWQQRAKPLVNPGRALLVCANRAENMTAGDILQSNGLLGQDAWKCLRGSELRPSDCGMLSFLKLVSAIKMGRLGFNHCVQILQ